MTDDADPATRPAVPAADEPVPRLPRGRGLRLSTMELIRIVGLAAVLGFLIVTQRPCANAVSTFVTGFDNERAVKQGGGSAIAPGAATGTSGSAGPAVDLDRYEQLRPDMTEAETKAAIERARAKAQ